jgi:tetratricopeptide (TPR) repeat protein
MTLAFLTCCVLLQAQALTPEVIEHAQAGAAAQKDGKLDVAIQEFRKVTELQPDSASGHSNLGEAYFQSGDYSAAIPELERALQLNPNLMGTHQTLGVVLLVQGDAEGALPHLEKTRTPELLGRAYLETGRLGSAIMALEAALDRQPKDPDVLYYFGHATDLAAKRTAGQLAKLDPATAPKSGAAADSASRPQDVASLQQALARQPNDTGLLLAFSRAAALASSQAFDQILQSSADSARAHQVLAERDVESGRLPEAEQEYAAAVRLRPYTAGVHMALGAVYASEGKLPAAEAQYAMESQLRPASADAVYRLGSTLLQEGSAGAATKAFAQADHLQPDTPQILLALGKAAFAANDAARAEAAWTKLLGIDKSGDLAAEAHLGLSTLYRRAGKPQDADREAAEYQRMKGREGRQDVR